MAEVERPRFRKKAVVGDWKISKEIGFGGQGSVWEVRRARGKAPPRALKACFVHEEKDRARFEREIALLEECKSHHVLAVIDAQPSWVEHVEGLPAFAYYVSERCNGSLEDVCGPDTSPWEKLSLFRQACDAVDSLHSRTSPVLHRDIKPANFLMAPEPRRLVLADFGIAREVSGATQLTETHEVVGSRFFRAPETLSGASVGPQSDVYSLGRLLEWMLSGRLPQDLVPTKLAKGDRISDDACDRLDALIARAAATDPRQRYTSAAELRAAIPDLWLDVRPAASVTVDATRAESPQVVLDSALEMARTSDAVGWRMLEREVRAAFPARAVAWRVALETPRVRDQEIQEHIGALTEIAMPRIALGLAAIFADKPALSNPQRLVNDLVGIEGWLPHGPTLLVEAPRFLLFVLNYLYGACCMEVGDVRSALDLCQVAVPVPRHSEHKPLWRQYDVAGWLDVFRDDSTRAWKYLISLYEHGVLTSLFPGEHHFKLALGQYSQLLSLLALGAAAPGLGNATDVSQIFLGVPPMYVLLPRELRNAVVRGVSGNPSTVAMAAECAKTDVASMRAAWPTWAAATGRFAASATNHSLWPGDLVLGELA